MGSLGDTGYVIVALSLLAHALAPNAKGGMELGGSAKFEGPIWGIMFMFGVLLIAIDNGFWWL